jgi:hypothetical protein
MRRAEQMVREDLHAALGPDYPSSLRDEQVARYRHLRDRKGETG